MSKNKWWVQLLITSITLTLINWDITDIDDHTIPQLVQYQTAPIHQSKQTTTIVYNKIGKIIYKIKAEDVQYYLTSELSWFTRPTMTLFNEEAIATWSLRADRAKLTKNQILYLYGHVEVNNLSATLKLEKIKTNNAQINLRTQDITSNEEVTVYGIHFTSNGMQMRGNLQNKTAELIDKVKTNYEI